MPKFWKPILTPGTFFYDHDKPPVKVEPAHLTHLHRQGNAMLAAGLSIPVIKEHSGHGSKHGKPVRLIERDRQAALVEHGAGWVEGFAVKKHDGQDWLGVQMDVPNEEDAQKLRDGRIKFVSPEIEDYPDGDGNLWKTVVTHVALTHKPVLKRQGPFEELQSLDQVAGVVAASVQLSLGSVQLSDRLRAPVGGINLAGKDFRGGEFIPTADVEKAGGREKVAKAIAQKVSGGSGGTSSEKPTGGKGGVVDGNDPGSHAEENAKTAAMVHQAIQANPSLFELSDTKSQAEAIGARALADHADLLNRMVERAKAGKGLSKHDREELLAADRSAFNELVSLKKAGKVKQFLQAAKPYMKTAGAMAMFIGAVGAFVGQVAVPVAAAIGSGLSKHILTTKDMYGFPAMPTRNTYVSDSLLKRAGVHMAVKKNGHDEDEVVGDDDAPGDDELADNFDDDEGDDSASGNSETDEGHDFSAAGDDLPDFDDEPEPDIGLEGILTDLAQLGIVLPQDTDETNFFAHFKAAISAIKGLQGLQDQGQGQQQITEEKPQMAGAFSTAANNGKSVVPAKIAAPVHDVRVDQAIQLSIGVASKAKQVSARTQLEAECTRLGPIVSDELRTALLTKADSIQLSLNTAGDAFLPDPLESVLEVLSKLKTPAPWNQSIAGSYSVSDSPAGFFDKDGKKETEEEKAKRIKGLAKQMAGVKVAS